MTEAVYYGLEFVALVGLVLSVPTISSTFAETSPSASSTTTPGATYWSGNAAVESFHHFERPVQSPRWASHVPSPHVPVRQNMPTGMAATGRGYDLA